uniref:CCHC-type domain-containing protein n=1 Tax=Hyaloperonospora arabidopsidis (strain Emoy2) TaxID=559515 RepID=M4BXS5_HYAAE
MELPAVHAAFQDVQSQTTVFGLLKQLQSMPLMDVSSTFGTSDMNSVGALLAGFFDFYAYRFNFELDVVSIRVGSTLLKTTKWSHAVSWRLSIEDPFELTHDVGRAVFHRKGQDLIRSEFKRASDFVSADRRLEDICASDATTWNFIATCYVCYSRDHPTRECDQCIRQNLACGGVCNTISRFSDCWYCGQQGHYKAECPMLFFRDIPRPVDVARTILENTSAVPIVPVTLPIAIPVSPAPTVVLSRICKEHPWERGLSMSNSPMLRLSMKKKRARHSSTSSALSSSQTSSWIWSLNGLSHAEKRQQQQRYQQQKYEQQCREFALLHRSRRCGDRNIRCGKSQVGKVLCSS